ncbi:hypothetical protein pb186bvf_002120 [Paramecium bursaria]
MHQSVNNTLDQNKSQKEYIIIDSPKIRVKLDEEEDELAKELKDYQNSETHKLQTIIYFHLFQLLINYGHKYKKFPMDYLFLLKQKVEIMENSIKQDNNQRDLFYQLNLEIQEFIEQEEPLKQGQASNISDGQKQAFTAQLNITTSHFYANNQKVFEELQKNELFQQSQQDNYLICELLLEIADKSLYKLEIIEIIEQIVQDLQIKDEQKIYIDIYICYITVNFNGALKLFNQAGVDDKKTPKYHFLQGLVYYFLTRDAECFFDKALKITPKDVNIKIQKGFYLYYKGICLSFDKSYQKAINEFEDCLKINNKKAEVYFFKGFITLIFQGICHFWLNREEDYIEALRLFEMGLILKPNFRFGELLKYYALQKLQMKQDELILLQKLNQYHQDYDTYVINYIIGIAQEFLNQFKCVFSENKKYVSSKELRNIQNLILMMNFFQINFLSHQQLEQIQNRFNPTLNKQEYSYNKKPTTFHKDDQLEFGQSVIQLQQLSIRSKGLPLYQMNQYQSFYCQHCGLLNQLSKSEQKF